MMSDEFNMDFNTRSVKSDCKHSWKIINYHDVDIIFMTVQTEQCIKCDMYRMRVRIMGDKFESRRIDMKQDDMILMEFIQNSRGLMNDE